MWQHIKNTEVEKVWCRLSGWLGWSIVSERGVPEDEVEEIDRTRLCWTWRSQQRAWNWLQEQWEASKIWKWGELWSLFGWYFKRSHSCWMKNGLKNGLSCAGELAQDARGRVGRAVWPQELCAWPLCSALCGCPLKLVWACQLASVSSDHGVWRVTEGADRSRWDPLHLPSSLTDGPASPVHCLHLNNFCSLFL